VGYVRAQFGDDRRRFVIIKARGLAIENALKVVQLIKENMGDIHSTTRLDIMRENPPRNAKHQSFNASSFGTDSIENEPTTDETAFRNAV
jgi:DNA-binding protein